jgi:two-component system, cell cycle sensor histidine kinase and response regulator CckA
VAGAVWNSSLRREVASRTADLAALLQVKDRLAAEVRENEARYRQLVESIQAILWQADEQMSSFSFVSQEAESILGYPSPMWREEAGFWAAHVHPEDLEHVMARCAEAAREGRPQQFDFRMNAADGRVVWLRMLVRVSPEEGSARGLAGVMLDVTEHKSLEDQFRHAQKMEAVGRLAGGVAHDFNNILTAITGYTDLMLRRLDPIDPLRDKVESIRKAADRAADLTTRLLAFGRKQVLAPRVLDLNAVVKGIEGMLRPLIGEDIRLVTRLERGLWSVKADRGQLEQVIMNLAVNARDAMSEGGILTVETANVERPPAASGRRPGAAQGRHVLLAVHDTGSGMDAELQSHLFEPFFTTKEPGRGTGLGLAIVYGIVQQSGGRILVDSTPGRGSSFRIYLPWADARPAGVDAALSPPEPSRGSETILLTEDEDAVRDLVGEVLRSGGYSVLEARHAGEALLIAERHSGPIHLLLTDVVMPHMGGRELAQRVAPLRPDTKVLFVSGYTDDTAMRNDLAQQQVHFLAKPFTPDDLMRKVREALGTPVRA